MAGQLWGWGSNSYGDIGDNTVINKSSPVQTIPTTNTWTYCENYNAYSAAIKSDGTLWTWGSNFYGNLGDNTTTHRSSPVQTVAFGTNWSSISYGYFSALAIKKDGTLWSWGYNAYGQLGDNSITNRSSPIQVLGNNNNWQQCSVGNNVSTAIKSDGTLWVWGRNLFGSLGDNSNLHRSSPVQTVAGGSNWLQVSSRWFNVAAIKTDGTLWTWGDNNLGQLGDNTRISKSSPVQIFGGGNNWSQVSVGKLCMAAIKKDGTLWSWGQNYYGGIGDNTTVHRSSPVQTVAGGNNWKWAACGNYHNAALKTDGTLWTWGPGWDGSLGDNSIVNKSSPVQTIMVGTRWSIVAMGYGVLAIYENTANQLGINTQPLAGYNSNNLLVQPKININDSAGSLVRIATNSVTVAVQSGTATLSGTTTVTAVNGVATFTDLVLTGSGAVTLRFTSSGLTQVDSSSFTVSLTLPIIPKRSEVSGKLPTSGQLNIGELAVNIADKKGYVKKSDGTIVNLFNGVVYDGGTF